MRLETLTVKDPAGDNVSLPLTWVHTLVIGSGAAGLNAAAQLRADQTTVLPAIADMLTIFPSRCLRMWGITAWQQRKHPFKLIFISTNGIPREINNLADLCLLLGCMQKVEVVDDQIVEEAIL